MKQNISYQMDGGLNTGLIIQKKSSKTKSLDENIIDDFKDKMKSKQWSFEKYQNYVKTNNDKSYLGINKTLYANMIGAFKTIVFKKSKSRTQISDAISFLHQDMMISPVTIQKISELLGLKISFSAIIRISTTSFLAKEKPTWVKRVLDANYFSGIW